jgi:hypothetical protein
MTYARIAVVMMAMAALVLAREPRGEDEGRDADDRPVLPKKAKSVAETKGESRFKLPARGAVWLVDADESNKIVHEGEFGAGDTYAFNAKEDKVYRNGKPLEEVRLDQQHTYRIYYLELPAKAKPARQAEQSKRPVPDTAKVMMEGRDKELSFKADARGTAYLYDASHDELVETFNLDAGDRITVSPKSNAMSVNGKTVSRDIELSRRITYRLLFDARK